MNLLAPLTITTASSQIVGPFPFRAPPEKLTIQANFVYGAGGTSTDVYLQTTLDNGLTWIDIANFHFLLASARLVYNLIDDTPNATQLIPSGGGLTANTAISGILDAQIRLKIISVGVYSGGTTLQVDASAR